jgi:P-type Ca2+ transporter type 2C
MELPEFPHSQTAKEIQDALGTSPAGLSVTEAAVRLDQFGKNILSEEKTSRLALFIHQFNSLLVWILILAAVISLFVADLKDFLVIVFLILVNGFIGFWQELRAETSLEALRNLTRSQSTVIRDGKPVTIPSSDLVPGDCVLLAEGDLVTADLRLVEVSALMVDESPLTGESLPVEKDPDTLVPADAPPYEYTNSALSGTMVVRGSGKGYVVKTGRSTYFAGIAKLAEGQSPQSPFTRAMNYFSRRYILFIVAIFGCVGIVALMQGRPYLQVAYLLVAQMVSAVPEGLPIVVTLVMVVGSLALVRQKTLVRHLPSVETLGSATVIVSDKTGTITEGRLAVQEVHALNRESLLFAAVLCNDAFENLGDPVDLALARWAEGSGEIRVRNPRIWVYPFDTRKKLMATANRTPDGDRFFVKGAWEELRKGAENTEDFTELENVLDSMAGRGLRILAFGAGNWNGEGSGRWNYRIVGLIGFADPPKTSVAAAVHDAKKAGIRVLMVTGDYAVTAREIARSVGIWEEGDRVLTGPEMELLDDDSLSAALGTTTVLARILPEQKYRIVHVLQQHGEIVTVTGDGVNDVPAIKAADLGIAMGSGTESAKSVAKMVILDNDLSVIVNAIRNGRVIADNIRKVIYYLGSTSISEIILISAAILAGLPLPLLPIQILWVNLVTDGVQDKTFPFIKEEGDVMARKPKKPESQFFDHPQIKRILLFSVVMGLLGFILFIHLLGHFPYKVAVTIMFTSFVCFQWFNGVQAQKEHEPFFVNLRRSLTINPLIFLGVGAGLLLQLAAIYLVPDWFGTVPLAWDQWLYPVALSLAAFVLVEAVKWSEWKGPYIHS